MAADIPLRAYPRTGTAVILVGQTFLSALKFDKYGRQECLPHRFSDRL
jgi:hypothetical protein